MISRSKGFYRIPLVFWILMGVTVVVLLGIPSHRYGWDLQVYQSGMLSLKAGHDPYLDGISSQLWFFNASALHRSELLPLSYIYGPITLPLLRWLSLYSFRLTGGVYWFFYILGVLAVIWVELRLVEAKESYAFALIAPAALFFPGLLIQADTIFSGNVAYIVYGSAFLAAYCGWRRGRWVCFYGVVLAASCLKLPLLSLLAIPLFSAKRQWISACLTAAAGVAMFVLQTLLWPTLFKNYLEVLAMQFSYSHDFGMSPAGLLAEALYAVVPYGTTSTLTYLVYAGPLLAGLFYFSHKFFMGYISLERWIPVLLVGTVLLSPRIMEYDVANLTLPMALVLWRFFARKHGLQRTILEMTISLLVLNGLGMYHWKGAECIVLVAVMLIGFYDLDLQVKGRTKQSPVCGDSFATVDAA